MTLASIEVKVIEMATDFTGEEESNL